MGLLGYYYNRHICYNNTNNNNSNNINQITL